MELKPVGLFASMPDGEMKRLSREMREIRHPKGAEIMVTGNDGVGFMVIQEGEAEVAMQDGRHRKLGPGDHFGEMALLDHRGRSASVTAKSDLVLATITEFGFKAFLEEHPEVSYRLLETLSRRLREAEAAKGKPA